MMNVNIRQNTQIPLQDISGSPMLVIDQDSAEDVLIPEPQKKPAKAPRGRPLSENALKVQQLVENCFTNSSYVHTVDFRETRYVQLRPPLSQRVRDHLLF